MGIVRNDKIIKLISQLPNLSQSSTRELMTLWVSG